MTLTQEDLREIEEEELKILSSGEFRFITRHKKSKNVVAITKSYETYSELLNDGFEHVYQSDKYSYLDVMKDVVGAGTILHGDKDLVEEVCQFVKVF